MKSAACALTACLLASACCFAGDTDVAGRAESVLRNHCHRCHGQDGSSKGGFGYVLDRDRLVARGKVVPGKPDESEVYLRVLHGEMPPKGEKARPAADDVAALRRWIEAGAPAATPVAGKRSFVADADVLHLVTTDLQTLDPQQRPFARYFTLTHLHNAGLPDEELDLCRQALSKLLNSLSWHPRITRPQALDPARTV
jgi:hypothetical protein